MSLYRLQQIDIQIDRLQARVQAIQDILDNDAELRLLNDQVLTVQAQHDQTEQALKQAEGNVHDQLIKIEQTQSSLYGEKSHSPKELQDLQNDLASLKRHLVVLEDLQIEAMITSEANEADLKSAQEKLLAGQGNRPIKIKVYWWNKERLRLNSTGFS